MLSHKSVSCSYAARAPAMARVPLKRPQLRKSPVASAQSGTGVGLSTDVQEYLDGMVNKDKVVAFIKGTKQFPQCGFSNTVVQILRSCNVPFETVNVLEDDRVRSGMKVYSQWPTFPQVYVEGEFLGGCDILVEMYQSGELKETMDRAMLS